jgi:nucleoside-diphosphate-sugar epimerase
MRTILVTGGAGFIGSHLVRGLLDRGDTVRVLDNFSTGLAGNLSGLGNSLEVIEGDVRIPDCVEQAVRGVDTVFHHAAFISVPKSVLEPVSCFEINVQGTLILLEACRKAGVRQVVLASSAAVYGESQDLPLNEQAELRTLSPYAVSKQVNEICASLYTRVYGMPVVALRYFNVYGPRQSPNSDYAAAIPIFIRRILDGNAPVIFGDGHQRRDFVYVRDIVKANLLAAESPEAAGKVFNICNGRETSLLDLLEVLSEILPGSPPPQFAPPRPGDIYRSLGDPTLAAQTLGFSAEVSLAEGLAETVAWMRS